MSDTAHTFTGSIGSAVAPDDALGLGVLLSIFSVLLMAVATNFAAAALLAAPFRR